jgi:hypothetical protein
MVNYNMDHLLYLDEIKIIWRAYMTYVHEKRQNKIELICIQKNILFTFFCANCLQVRCDKDKKYLWLSIWAGKDYSFTLFFEWLRLRFPFEFE